MNIFLYWFLSWDGQIGYARVQKNLVRGRTRFAHLWWWLHMLKLSEFRANGEILNHKLILYQWYTRNSKYNVEYFLQRNLQNWKLTIKLILRCFGLSVYHFSCLTVLYLSILCQFYSYWKQQFCIRSLETYKLYDIIC